MFLDTFKCLLNDLNTFWQWWPHSCPKKDIRFRKCNTAAERLALTFWFLATWDAQQSLSFSYRLGKSTVIKIISERCEAICQCLKKDYLNPSKAPAQWQNIADQYKENWNMPNVIGAIDGGYIRIECPKLSDTQYYNYKGFCSIILLAICDVNYCFTLFDLGQFDSGSNNDSGLQANSELAQLFE